MLDDINLFSDKNRELRKYWFFFFCVAICGYLSLIVSSYPHSDDYCRYIKNSGVGAFSSHRYMTFIIEVFTYLSSVVTDATPFTQVVSCAFLAYCAVICLKIFNVNLKNKLEVLCFVPVVINPYMLEIMMFKFDNPFSTLSLLFVLISAYISIQNDRQGFVTQTGFLLLSIFMYQSASSAYFIVCISIFIREIASGTTLKKTIVKMRYWIYTLLTVAIVYIPFAYSLEYCSSKNDGGAIAFPTNVENISIILDNINRYFSSLYTDWYDNTAGLMFFTLCIIFVVNVMLGMLIRVKSIASILSALIGLFLLFLCPMGICILLKVISFEGNESILPRSLYSIGILMSIVLHGNCRLFNISGGTYKFYGFIVSVLCIWNMIFLNSAANIICSFRQLQYSVFYDVTKDIYAITQDKNKNKSISGLCITGSVWSKSMDKFFELYPIMHRIIPEKWSIPMYCQLMLMDNEIANRILKYRPFYKRFNIEKYSEKQLIKQASRYNIYMLDKKMIWVDFPNENKYAENNIAYARFGDNYSKE